MRRFCVLLLLGFASVCLGAKPSARSKPQEKDPVYEQKTLSEWTLQARDTDSQARSEAAFALGNFDAKAVPVLAELLKDKDAGVRTQAIEALGELGTQAEAAVPNLTDLLREGDAEVRSAVPGTLGRIGPTAIPALTELSRDIA